VYSLVIDDIGSAFEPRADARKRLDDFFDVLSGVKEPPPVTLETASTKDPSKFKTRAEFFAARDKELREHWGHAPEQQAAWAL
jgi:hypothetical protein